MATTTSSVYGTASNAKLGAPVVGAAEHWGIVSGRKLERAFELRTNDNIVITFDDPRNDNVDLAQKDVELVGEDNYVERRRHVRVNV